MAFQLDIELINRFGKKLIEDTKQSLDANGSTASGKTKESLRYELTPTSFKFYGRAFINTLEVGRKPTTADGDGSLRDAILKWIDDKNIILKEGQTKEGLSWAISKKIHEEGDLLHRTKSNFQKMNAPTQIIYGVINDGRLNQLKSSLLFDVVTQVKKEIKDAYNVNS